MDWSALSLSLELALGTIALLLPAAIWAGRILARHTLPAQPLLEALLALPLVLPPTVLGFYLLVALGKDSVVGGFFQALTGHTLAFSFQGLLLASVLVNIPFAVQPVQRAFEAIPPHVHDAAACCGLSSWRILWRIELPLAWPGILSALVLTFAHTLGEFGVVLMVGGNIPGETKTIAIAIYDRVQAFDTAGAGVMAATLLAISMIAIAFTYLMTTSRPRSSND